MLIDQLYRPHSNYLYKGLDQGYKTEQQRLVESVVLTNPLFEQWRSVGRMIAERKMTEPEILDLFAKIETGATQAGSNRTVVGRAKDTTVKAFTNTRDAFNSVMSRIQDSTPVQAVDVAYDKATDSVANMVGGQKSQIMRAIKGYRNLVKEYPKTAGFAKAALVAIAGLATGGAGLPAIAGLTYALDSAIRGDKLSSVIGKGAGAAAVTWGAQQAAGMIGGSAPDGGAGSAPDGGAGSAPDGGAGSAPNLDAETAARNAAYGKAYGIDGADTLDQMNAAIMKTAEPGTVPADYSQLGAGAGQTATAYTVQSGDTLSQIAQRLNVSVDELMNLNPQLTNPDVLNVGQKLSIPSATGSPVYQGGVGTSADTMAKIGTGQYTDSAISQAMAKKVRESVQFKILPAGQLFDRKLTVMNWALNESEGKPQGKSVHLTSLGVYTVFENVNRYARAVVMEADTGPGRPDLPDEYRPDMPGGSGGYDKSKKGAVGKGLDWINKAAGKVGGALSTFGHQFTTKITKDKLKMNWHQAGKPSDSDALAAFLIKQGVPQAVLQDVYGAMKLPMPANTGARPAANTSRTAPQNVGAGIQTGDIFAIDPDTGKPYDADKLKAMYGKKAPPASTTAASPASTTAASPNFAPSASYGKTTMSFKTPTGQTMPVMSQPTVPTAAKVQQPTAANLAQKPAAAAQTTPSSVAPNGFTAANIMKMPGMTTAVGAPPKTPVVPAPTATTGKLGPTAPATTAQGPSTASQPISIGGQTIKPTDPLYAKVQQQLAAQQAAPKSTTAPAATTASSAITRPQGGGRQPGVLSQDPRAVRRREQRAAARQMAMAEMVKNVKTMLEAVQDKNDVAFIRKYISNQFLRHQMVSESFQIKEKKLLKEVTRIGAIRRREHSKRSTI